MKVVKVKYDEGIIWLAEGIDGWKAVINQSLGIIPLVLISYCVVWNNGWTILKLLFSDS
jgi:hypothetical protein